MSRIAACGAALACSALFVGFGAVSGAGAQEGAAAALAPPAAEADLALAARIAEVESGLAPPIVLAGEPRPRWSLEERMAHYNTAGLSVAVLVNGELSWAKGYGVRDAEGSAPVDAETLFQAASISKPVTAIGVMRLVERGALALNETVNSRLRSWRIPDNELTEAAPVTVRHLLTHSGGLTVHGFPGYAQGAAIPTTAEVLDGRAPANTPPVLVDTPPGETWRYSGGGYTVLQQLVEDVTGRAFPKVMSELVLEPAGMSRSRFEQPLSAASLENAASGHVGEDSAPMPGVSHTYPELAAAGLWTTPADLLALTSAILDSRAGAEGALLSEDAALEMLAAQIEMQGLGFQLTDARDGVVFGHSGSNAGFRSQWFAYEDGRGGAAVMTNADTGGALIAEILRAISSAYGWSYGAPLERAAVSLPSETVAALTGTYRAEIPGMGPVDIEIAVQGQALLIEAAPLLEKQMLYAASSDELFVTQGPTFNVMSDPSGAPVTLELAGTGLLATRVEGALPD